MTTRLLSCLSLHEPIVFTCFMEVLMTRTPPCDEPTALASAAATWIGDVTTELLRHDLTPVAADIEAVDIWEILSDFGRDAQGALSRNPVEVARECLRGMD